MAFAAVRAEVRAALLLGMFRSWWCVLLSTRWISTSSGLSSSFFTCARESARARESEWVWACVLEVFTYQLCAHACEYACMHRACVREGEGREGGQGGGERDLLEKLLGESHSTRKVACFEIHGGQLGLDSMAQEGALFLLAPLYRFHTQLQLQLRRPYMYVSCTLHIVR